jgi:DNA invertase Pin-like site-specific DNA recombinase
MGKAMAHMAVVFAELERDFIRSRTREALAVHGDQEVFADELV